MTREAQKATDKLVEDHNEQPFEVSGYDFDATPEALAERKAVEDHNDSKAAR